MSLSLGLILVLLLGLSYAWLRISLSGDKSNVIKSGTLSLYLDESMTEGIQVENAIPTSIEMALKEEPYHFKVVNDGSINAEYSLYLNNEGTVTNVSMFNYALMREDKIIAIDKLNKITGSANVKKAITIGTIRPKETADYKLYLWVDANYKKGTPSFIGRLEINATQQKTRNLSNHIEEACNGIDNCTRQKGDFTYFQQGYYGQAKKYIWYSGKLWVATGYDKSGNVKAMTESEVTKMPWGPTLDYQGSYVEAWLNDEFLPTLHDYQNFLVMNSSWNYSHEITGTGWWDTWPIGTDRIVQGPVGLLNKEDFFYASEQSGHFNSTDLIFGQIGQYYYVGTPLTNERLMVGGTGWVNTGGFDLNSTNFAGVIPSIVFQKNVEVISGEGTRENPYLLKGDDQGKKGDLLNTRYSGEYIAFGEGVNTSYRISKIENGLTKIVSTRQLLNLKITESGQSVRPLNELDYNEETNVEFYPYSYTTTGNLNRWDGSSKDYPIAYLLNHNFLTPVSEFLSKNAQSMIAVDQKWYPGKVLAKEDYRLLKNDSNANVATVGLLSFGEPYNVIQKIDDVSMLSFTDAPNSEKGLLLVNDGTNFYDDSTWTNTKETGPFRPSMYLKESVKIKSGSGTKMDPYILEG